MSIKMLHTCIRVKDLDTSLAFYTEAFGLKETRRKDSQIINSHLFIWYLKKVALS
ncbi:lactoylglutathione lyase [Listeria riparia FSL S10-1204]|uniref:Lactoylglutathione lyase n=1 Tax=Listeria riparia FSL S10-1204 TaxID=1265816 RepID=W7DBW9_9LIST|nr:lactoylglutathione lyase [Listeria riparia FSL S10-1204]